MQSLTLSERCRYAGICDQNMQAAELLDDLGYNLICAIDILHVRLESRYPRVRRLLLDEGDCFVEARSCGERNGRASFGKEHRGALTDTSRCSSD